uniref:Uncharacterized protein n=1 Tax=Setaria viridis TaxID=4556 RepID=A0A4U6W7V2_SETVI|nr:hypothetical protein SEVIR_1G083150v2 [Setaria viridis]
MGNSLAAPIANSPPAWDEMGPRPGSNRVVFAGDVRRRCRPMKANHFRTLNKNFQLQDLRSLCPACNMLYIVCSVLPKPVLVACCKD